MSRTASVRSASATLRFASDSDVLVTCTVVADTRSDVAAGVYGNAPPLRPALVSDQSENVDVDTDEPLWFDREL